jgi:hypothetical protein
MAAVLCGGQLEAAHSEAMTIVAGVMQHSKSAAVSALTRVMERYGGMGCRLCVHVHCRLCGMLSRTCLLDCSFAHDRYMESGVRRAWSTWQMCLLRYYKVRALPWGPFLFSFTPHSRTLCVDPPLSEQSSVRSTHADASAQAAQLARVQALAAASQDSARRSSLRRILFRLQYRLVGMMSPCFPGSPPLSLPWLGCELRRSCGQPVVGYMHSAPRSRSSTGGRRG